MLIVNDNVLDDIAKGFAIPARPVLLNKLQALMMAEDPSITDISQAIMEDVAISAIIIKTINSPLYGLARTISDIKRAVSYIGIQGVYTLIMGILLKREFNQKNPNLFENFWQDANNIANVMVLIGKKVNHQSPTEELFTIGLFHDCGMPVLSLKYKNYADVLNKAQYLPSHSLTDVEEHLLQVNHATIGYYVASSWRLPKSICQLILRHHERDFLSTLDCSTIQSEFAILKMAENFIEQSKNFNDHNDWPYIKEAIFTVLNISDDDYQNLFEESLEYLTSLN